MPRLFQPLLRETEKLLLRSIVAEELERFDQLAAELFRLLSDEETLRFIPEKRLSSLAEAEHWLKVALINAPKGRKAYMGNHILFISYENSILTVKVNPNDGSENHLYLHVERDELNVACTCGMPVTNFVITHT